MGMQRAKGTKGHSLKNHKTKAAKSEEQEQQLPESGEAKGLINNQTYGRLYAGMLKCRMVEERVCAVLGRQKSAISVKRAIGQEAATVGTVAVLQSEDVLAPSDRSLIAQTMAGAPLKTVFEQLLGVAGKVNSAHANGVDAPLLHVAPAARLESQVALATGLALAHKSSKKSDLVLAISGGSLSESDELRATLEFAARNRLPIVYVVSSDETANDSQGENEEVITMAQSCGVTVITVDGSDAVAVYRVASESISRARKGIGPTLINCRFLPGRVEGNARRKSSPRSQDPLVHMESYMKKRNAWSDSWKQGLVKQFTREIESAVNNVERASAKKRTGKRGPNR